MNFENMEQAAAYIKIHGKEISAKSFEGDNLCLDIVLWYGLHCKLPIDPRPVDGFLTKLTEYAIIELISASAQKV